MSVPKGQIWLVVIAVFFAVLTLVSAGRCPYSFYWSGYTLYYCEDLNLTRRNFTSSGDRSLVVKTDIYVNLPNASINHAAFLITHNQSTTEYDATGRIQNCSLMNTTCRFSSEISGGEVGFLNFEGVFKPANGIFNALVSLNLSMSCWPCPEYQNCTSSSCSKDYQCEYNYLCKEGEVCVNNTCKACPPTCDDFNACTEDFCSARTDYECQHRTMCREDETCINGAACVLLCGLQDNFCPPNCTTSRDMDCCANAERVWCNDTCCSYNQICVDGTCLLPQQPVQNVTANATNPPPQTENATVQNVTIAQQPNVTIVNQTNETVPAQNAAQNVTVVYITQNATTNQTAPLQQSNATPNQTIYVYVQGNLTEGDRAETTAAVTSLVVSLNKAETRFLGIKLAYDEARKANKIVERAEEFLNYSARLIEQTRAAITQNNLKDASLFLKRVDENLDEAERIISGAGTNWFTAAFDFLKNEIPKKFFWLVVGLAFASIIGAYRYWKWQGEWKKQQGLFYRYQQYRK